MKPWACAMIEPMNSGKTIGTGVIGVALIIAAAWLGYEDYADGESGSGSTPASTTSTPGTGGATAEASTSARAAEPTAQLSGLPVCPLPELPEQASLVVDDILAGGPFDYPDNDGVRFGNYEGILPDEAGNYYREYTVETPGLSHRGPLRIVTGGNEQRDPEVWYYTSDHYESFCEIPDAED